MTGGRFFHNISAGDVSRHQVWSELDPAEFKIKCLPHCANEHGLTQARYALQEDMATAQDANQDMAHYILLANDYLAHLCFHVGRRFPKFGYG